MNVDLLRIDPPQIYPLLLVLTRDNVAFNCSLPHQVTVILLLVVWRMTALSALVKEERA